MSLTSPKDEIAPGESIDLSWEVLPADAADNTVSFSSSAKDIASVDGNGRVTGIKDGSAVITVTTNDGGYTASCNVLVKTPLKTEFNMLPGEVQRLRLNMEGRYTYGTAVGEIYTFGPTFRAENSNTPRHLAEFWMIEPEMAFYDINDNMELAEDFVKFLVHIERTIGNH